MKPIGYVSALMVSILTFSLAASQASAAIVNGGFETGDLSSWTVLGNIEVSTGGNYVGAGVVAPDSGTYAALLNSNNIAAATIASALGITEAELEASNGGANATNGSLISQSSSAVVGDVFAFRWNFVEQDYLPYDDWAFYGISVNGGPAAITKFASLGTVGPGGGTTINGWETLTVNINRSGNYAFYFGIVNAVDTALDSRLWIDGVGGSGSLATVPEPTSALVFGLGALGAAFSRRRLRGKIARTPKA